MSEGNPLFLKIGFTLASFQKAGKIPSRSDLLNSFVRGSAIIIAVSFRILAGSLSGPVVLFGSNELRAFSTSRLVTSIELRVGMGGV